MYSFPSSAEGSTVVLDTTICFPVVAIVTVQGSFGMLNVYTPFDSTAEFSAVSLWPLKVTLSRIYPLFTVGVILTSAPPLTYIPSGSIYCDVLPVMVYVAAFSLDTTSNE